ncbi:MAG: hypothetical protein AB7F64_05380 [Gammaproteobacteria bacterium]
MYPETTNTINIKLSLFKLDKLKLLLKRLNNLFLNDDEADYYVFEEYKNAFIKHLKKCLKDESLHLSGLNVTQYADLIKKSGISEEELYLRGMMCKLDYFDFGILFIKNDENAEKEFTKYSNAVKEIMSFWKKKMIYNADMDDVLTKSIVSKLIDVWFICDPDKGKIKILNSNSALIVESVIREVTQQVVVLYIQDKINSRYKNALNKVLSRYLRDIIFCKNQPVNNGPLKLYLNRQHEKYAENVAIEFIDKLHCGAISKDDADNFCVNFSLKIYQLFKKNGFYDFDESDKIVLNDLLKYVLNMSVEALLNIWRLKNLGMVENIIIDPFLSGSRFSEVIYPQLNGPGIFEFIDNLLNQMMLQDDRTVCNDFIDLINSGRKYKVEDIFCSSEYISENSTLDSSELSSDSIDDDVSSSGSELAELNLGSLEVIEDDPNLCQATFIKEQDTQKTNRSSVNVTNTGSAANLIGAGLIGATLVGLAISSFWNKRKSNKPAVEIIFGDDGEVTVKSNLRK